MNPAVLVLDRLLKKGMFESQVEPRIQDTEESLQQRQAVVECFPSIAVGLKAYAEADSTEHCVKYIENCKDLTYPVSQPLFPLEKGSRSLIVAFNTQLISGGYVKNREAFDAWVLKGDFDLRAVIIQFSERLKLLSVDLVLPSSEERNIPQTLFRTEDGYAFVSIGRDGWLHYESETLSIDAGSYLYYALGMREEGTLLRKQFGSGGDLDEKIGFPGAQRYLERNLGGLGDYLRGLAQEMKDKQERQVR